MDHQDFSREKLETLNPLLKKMRERSEKAKEALKDHEDPKKLRKAQEDVQKAYDLLVLPKEAFQSAHPSIAVRYLTSLEKLKGDRDSFCAAETCRKAASPLKQFQGKSKMTLGLLKALSAEIDTDLFHQLTNYNFSKPGKL